MTVALGIDQGTSGTTVVVVDEDLNLRRRVSQPISTSNTALGSVEQDPVEVLDSIICCVEEALDNLSVDPAPISAGFAHQGETVLAWDRNTLTPLTPAIVWSDRRSESVVARLRDNGIDVTVASLSGMRLESYFCAAKYRWMLDSHPNLLTAATDKVLRLGTLETWVLEKLGANPSTDAGTASRSQLVRLGGADWDADLLSIFDIDPGWLVPIVPSLGYRGELTHQKWAKDLSLHGVLVDQPAALIGTGGMRSGSMKATYGTGAFVVANAGREKPVDQMDIVASVGWTDAAGPVYTLDGGVFSAGSAIDWLGRLGIDVSNAAHERLRGRPPAPVQVMPALHGLGAPFWDREATGQILGLRADTTADDLLQGLLDSLAFRVREIIQAIVAIGFEPPPALRVDGGLARSNYLMQRQADALGLPVEVGVTKEATALGAAMLAGISGKNWGTDSLNLLAGQTKKTYAPRDLDTTRNAFNAWQESFR